MQHFSEAVKQSGIRFALVLRMKPYELDIAVSWEFMPSRDDYLAAKQRAWTRDELTAVKSPIASAARDVRGERPWQLDPGMPCNTLAQRWSFFRELVGSEMEWHGLTQQLWTVKYNHARARAGQCRHRAKVLSFSRNLIARGSPVDMRNTLLHEIAHALAGPSHGHDRTWRAHALRIGCNGQRCHKMELAPRKWSYVCTHGCWNVARFKRSSSHAGATCKQCGAACIYKLN